MPSFTLQVLFAAALLQVISNGRVNSQFIPNLISFGDFMEYQVGILRACVSPNLSDSSSHENRTTFLQIHNSFKECTFNVGPTEFDGDYMNMDRMGYICQNRTQYLECWDKMKNETLNKCGKDKQEFLPVVYRSTVESFCRNDNGTTNIKNLKQAIVEDRSNTEKNCPPETGIHWLDNCFSFVTTMNSADVCERHTAIDKCFQKSSCNDIKFARLSEQMYDDARPLLNCSLRRVRRT